LRDGATNEIQDIEIRKPGPQRLVLDLGNL